MLSYLTTTIICILLYLSCSCVRFKGDEWFINKEERTRVLFHNVSLKLLSFNPNLQSNKQNKYMFFFFFGSGRYKPPSTLILSTPLDTTTRHPVRATLARIPVTSAYRLASHISSVVPCSVFTYAVNTLRADGHVANDSRSLVICGPQWNIPSEVGNRISVFELRRWILGCPLENVYNSPNLVKFHFRKTGYAINSEQ